MVSIKKLLATAAVGLAVGMMASAASAEIQKENFKVVGTWHNLPPFYMFEKPFWEKQIEKDSGGKITGTIKPITELGLKGFEVARLTKIGVFDVAFASYGYVASEAPEIEGADLSSVSNSFPEALKVVHAYEPYMSKIFAKKYGLKYLFSYPFPSQMIFCSKPFTKLSDLAGKKVRVYATTLGDFVEGLGGTSVTISFAEVVPALQKGVADCGITGSMAAYNAKWQEVITHAMTVRVGMGMAFMAMNMKKWNSLNADTQKFFVDESKRLEGEMWKAMEAEDNMALICLSGKGGKCTRGEPGHVIITNPSPADEALRRKVLLNHVLKAWADRCSAECVKEWNATAGKVVHLTAKK